MTRFAEIRGNAFFGFKIHKNKDTMFIFSIWSRTKGAYVQKKNEVNLTCRS